MSDRLSAVFAALADPTRRAILERLAAKEHSVKELAEPFAMSLPAISKHLKVLERAGLISRGREAQWRPCRLEAAPFKDVSAWLEHYRRFWDESFDRLGEYLQEMGSGKELTDEQNAASLALGLAQALVGQVLPLPQEMKEVPNAGGDDEPKQ